MGKIRLGISSCLLGEKVRYDGQHKLDRFIKNSLGRYCEFIAVCPEIECGLGVPRETMILVGTVDNPKLMTRFSKIDITPKMKTWSKNKLKELEKLNLDGFIFKTKSPSSGMRDIPVFDINWENNKISRKGGVGIFAKMFMDKFTDIPIEDDGRLHDPVLREHFIEKLFIFKTWREEVRDFNSLQKFHEKYKFTFMAYSSSVLKELGQFLANLSKRKFNKTSKIEYFNIMLKLLSFKKTNKKHQNVLMHIFGFFKNEISSFEKNEFLDLIKDYKDYNIPIIVPITMLRHFANKYQKSYLLKQKYLFFHPSELKLLNYI